MKNYFELAENVNAFDFMNIEEGAVKEIKNAVDAWKKSGKPNYPGTSNNLWSGDCVILSPYNNNGKLSFECYVFEALLNDFKKYKKGAESLEFVTECDIDEFDSKDDKTIYGTYYVHTNISFE